VFVGALVTFGSSGLIDNLLAGILMTYKSESSFAPSHTS